MPSNYQNLHLTASASQNCWGFFILGEIICKIKKSRYSSSRLTILHHYHLLVSKQRDKLRAKSDKQAIVSNRISEIRQLVKSGHVGT